MRPGILITTIKDGDRFERTAVEQVFGPYLRDGKLDCLYFCEPGSAFFYATVSIGDGRSIDKFSIHRPPSYGQCPQFWNCIFDVLQRTRTILIWCATGPYACCCMARSSFSDGFSAKFIEEFGPPSIVSSGTDIASVLSPDLSALPHREDQG